MNEPTTSPAAEPPPRAFTLRAVLIGLALAAALAVLTPWNDWYLRNTFLFSNYLPPVVTVLLLGFGLVVNPLLRERRLRPGELVVITVMVLSVGGVASSGLMRLWPGAVAGVSRHLARTAPAQLKVPLGDAEQQAAGGGAAWRWGVPRDLFLGIPAQGDVPINDAEYKHVVDGYLEGMRSPVAGTTSLDKLPERLGGAFGLVDVEGARIGHRARVTWTDAAGIRHENDLALGGMALAQARDHAGVLDLDSDTGRALSGARSGAVVELPGGTATIASVEQPPVPWYAWLPPLLAWSPLLLGTVVASVAIAFLVRRQWIDNERLPYPVAAVSWSFIEAPAPGRLLAAIFTERAFWLGLVVAAIIITWRGLYALKVIPVDFVLQIDLIHAPGAPFSGSASAWNLYETSFLLTPRVYLSIFAIAFFLPLDLSFSLWFSFVLTNAVVWVMKDRLGMGASLTWVNCRSVGFGAFMAMAPLIIWLGRGYYWSALKAAVGIAKDEPSRAAAPYVWATFAGSASIALFFVAHGASFAHGALMTLLFLGSLLVIARVLAEAGVPFLQVPLNINTLFFTLVGFGAPVQALVALSTIGMTLLPDGRESLMPFAANATYLGERARVPHRRLSSLMIVAATIGVVLAAGSMIYNSYLGSGHADGWVPYAADIDLIASRKANPDADQVATGHQLVAYGVGATAVTVCGVARMLMPAWPLHPLAWCVTFSYPAGHCWFSFLLAWICKGLVMRYGGVGLYRRLKPVAIGLIAGEALAMFVFIVIKIVAALGQHQLEAYNALPG
ncbi:MAG TPA: DUF6785 family protein [Planctomycetota bacterium]|nr:DUF6785 family protein [Planctomycetota bacterium]